MKIARLIACGFAALSLASSAYATSQDTTQQPTDESSAQVATSDQQTQGQDQQAQAQTQDQGQTQDQTQASASSSSSSSSTSTSKVDLNTADATAIAHAVKGLGMKRAQAIVAYRKTNGNFKSVEDLSKVKGFSASFLKKHHEALVNAFDFS